MSAIVVTGATGYIGARLVAASLRRGRPVLAASRTRPADPELPWLPYRLESPPPASSFPLEATVVHLAADTRSGDAFDRAAEIAAVEHLLAAAAERQMRLVFVSSQAARADAPSAYGRTKWQAEQLVLAAGGSVVRPGLVYGGRAAGLFRQLVDQVRRSKLLPALVPSPRVQPIHIDDLVEGLLRIVERTDLAPGAWNLAMEPVSFTDFLRAIATQRLRVRRAFVPVPTKLVGLAVTIANRALGPRYDPARVRSLVDLPAWSCAGDLRRLDLRLRPLASGMHPAGSDRRRRLLQEGRALVSYVLGERASRALIRRYARSVEGMRTGRALRLPSLALAWPRSLAALDGGAWLRAARADELAWRLDAATVIAEATPRGARRFLLLAPAGGMVGASVALAGAVVAEAFWLLVRRIGSPWLRRALVQPASDA